MATTKNIIMKQFNGTDYDTLYPKTVYNQVSGVAPAGYGLGGIGKQVTDMNNAQESGFYSALGASNLPPNVESVQYGSVLVLSSQANRVTQVYFQDVTDGTGVIAVRRLNGNGWSQWEFINPPMKLGVEYRTTERYHGKPVYTKEISIGAIGSGSGNVEHGIADISVVVGLIGTNSYGPTLNTHPYMTSFFANRQYVRWETTQAISGTSYAVLRYTKTTD